MALLSNHSRCKRHSLPGAMSRYAHKTVNTCAQQVPSRLSAKRSFQNRSNCSSLHNSKNNQHGPPLPRMTNEKIPQPHLHSETGGMLRHRPVSREQGQTHLLLVLGIEDLDAFKPRLLLTVVDLAQVKDMPLHDPSAAASAAFHDGPV